MTAYDRLAYLYGERDTSFCAARASVIRRYEPALALAKAEYAAFVEARQAAAKETPRVDL